jgi:hypothetical protein
MKMKPTVGAALAVLILGVAGIAAPAQAHSSKHYYDRYYDSVRHYHHVRGPAYGWPGQPLGPAYWGTTGPELMPDPSTCGPGACQDNPRY